jgi:integrase
MHAILWSGGRLPIPAQAGPELHPLFIVAHATGVRKGELLKVRWEQIDWQAEEIVLRKGETKNKAARVLPFLTDDMATYLKAAKEHRDANYPQSPWVFNRNGSRSRTSSVHGI